MSGGQTFYRLAHEVPRGAILRSAADCETDEGLGVKRVMRNQDKIMREWSKFE
jgi:hypothetical protein